MRTAQITVSYQETCSLPEYSNVRPGITYVLDLEPGDDADDIRQHYTAMARTFVQQQIDAALEAHGKAPKYYAGPRVQLLQSPHGRHQDILIMPDNRDDWPRGWTHVMYPQESRRLRPTYALEVAARLANQRGGVVVDCSENMLALAEWQERNQAAVEDGTGARMPIHTDVEW